MGPQFVFNVSPCPSQTMRGKSDHSFTTILGLIQQVDATKKNAEASPQALRHVTTTMVAELHVANEQAMDLNMPPQHVVLPAAGRP